MKSIKPGRGPSMMSGIVGVIMVCVGIFWTVVAAQLSPVMMIFGILWTCIAIVTTVFNFKNATGKNRYSSFDIVDSSDEPDPLNQRFGEPQRDSEDIESSFCPYCGNAVQDDFEFCNSCGKKLP